MIESPRPVFRTLRIHEAAYRQLVDSGLAGDTRTEIVERLIRHWLVCPNAQTERLAALARRVAATASPRR